MKINKPKNQCIEVPLWFIKDYMPKAPSGYTHVYLYLLALSYKSQRDISLEKVAKSLKMLYSEVISALGYWSEQGIINFKADSPDEVLSFLMQPISDQLSLEGLYGSLMNESPKTSDVFAELAAEESSESPEANVISFEQQNTMQNHSTTVDSTLKDKNDQIIKNTIDKVDTHNSVNINTHTNVETTTVKDTSNTVIKNKIEQTAHGKGFSSLVRPCYKDEEIQRYKAQSLEYTQLLAYAQQLFGRPLSSEMPKLLYGLYDWLGMDFDVIKCLLKYCHEKNKFTIYYIEKTAIGWVENDGIKTVEQAKAKLEEEKKYYTILKKLGIQRDILTSIDKEYIDKWIDTWGFTFEMIIKACEKTVAATSNPNLSYTDKILSAWKKDNIKTLEAIEVSDTAYYAKKATETKPSKTWVMPKKKTRFNIMDSRTWDFEELDRLEDEYIERMIKEEIKI